MVQSLDVWAWAVGVNEGLAEVSTLNPATLSSKTPSLMP